MRTFYVRDLETVEGGMSSKGAQVKYKSYEGYWIKADTLGYEGLSEVVVSRFATQLGLNCVAYFPCRIINLNGSVVLGCYSSDFTVSSNGVFSEYTLYNLLISYSPRFIHHWSEWSIFKRWQLCVDALVNKMDIDELVQYMACVLVLDSITFNTDRHLSNFTFLSCDDVTFHPAPIFDNGAALFSDVVHLFPLNYDASECKRRAKARPFSTSFEKQAQFFVSLASMSFPNRSIVVQMSDLTEVYSKGIINRVQQALKSGAASYNIAVTFT